MALDLKKVPKWAYYASGAVIVGTIGVKLWGNRGGGPTTEAVAVDGEPGPTGMGPTGTYATTSTVPVFVGGDNSSDSADGQSYFGSLVDGAFGLATAALGTASDTANTISDAFSNQSDAYLASQGQYQDTVGALAGQALQNQNDYAQKVLDIMNAGQAPAAVQQTPVINYVQPDSPAPQNVPAPQPYTPPAPAPSPAAPTRAPRPADSRYNQYNDATNMWYWEKTAAADGVTSKGNKYKKGQKIHVYTDGSVSLA